MQTEETRAHIDAIITAIRTERIEGVAKPVRLNMRVIRRDETCGTIACILGFSEMVAGVPITVTSPEGDDAARLGISIPESDRLFYGDDFQLKPLSQITKDHAILALETIRDTGKFPGWDSITDPAG